MSLLVKALEKAAQDRNENSAARPPSGATNTGAQTSNTGKTSSGAGELSLEPIAQQQASLQAAAGSSANTNADAAKAAALMRASQRDASGGFGAYARGNPLMMFGSLVVLFLLGYGVYVFLQLNPGLFSTPQPPALKAASTTPVTPPPPPAVGSVSAQPASPLTSLLPTLQASTEKEKPAPPPAAPPAAAVNVAAPTAPAPPAVPPAQRDTIKVTAGGAAPALNPVLTEAYKALESGNLDASQRLYNQLLRIEPNSVDALLGLAAIASQQGDSSQASRHYLKVLEVDPRNALAQAGLIGMLGRADPLAAESRLRQLIAHDPSAYLYFTLGNLHADQNRWPDAQQAYFQAHNLQPDNPDYAYNLAIGLEHVGQPKLALNFYRHALQRATATGRANFNTAAAQERVSKLEKVVQ